MGDGVKRVLEREQPIIKKLRRVGRRLDDGHQGDRPGVDGVLTDGGFWWGPDGEEFKRFSFRRHHGRFAGRKAGLLVALISGEDSPLVDRFAAKMGIADVARAARTRRRPSATSPSGMVWDCEKICFMGDDVNDLAGHGAGGLAAAPANAAACASGAADFVTSAGRQGRRARTGRSLLAARTAASSTDPA